MVLVLVCAAQFMVILDAAIVNVALPSVRDDLGFTTAGLAWVVNGYLLTFAGFMLVGGRAADLLGPRRVLTAGLAVFGAASLAAGLATTPGVLVAARAVQGVGAALLAPATLAVVNTAFAEPAARARALGAWSAAGGIGGTSGALAGGAVTTALSWRWVFLINVPIGAALIGIALLARAGDRPVRREPLDLIGAVTATAGLAALVYGVMRDTGNLVPIGAGVLLLGAFAVVEARVAARPMVPPRLLAVRPVAAGNAMLLLFGGIAMAMWYFTSLYLQNVMGYTPLRAGLGQTPAAVTFVAVARLSAALLPRTGARPLLLAGCAAFVAGFGWLAQAPPGAAYATAILGPTLLVAAGIGLVFPTLMAVATAGVPESDAGIAGGLASTASQVGGALGLAALATLTQYHHVFLTAAGLAVAIAALSGLLPRPAR